MNSFWKTFLAALLAFVVANFLIGIFGIMILAGLAAGFSKSVSQVQNNSVLRIDFSRPVNDSPPESPFAGFDPRSLKINRSNTLLSVLNAIERAATDDRIRGVYLDLGSYGGMGAATLEEIRNALVQFKESGKFIVSYSDYYTQGAYYLATVSDKIYLNPQGGIYWMGLSSNTMFFKGLLEKLGIEPEVIRHGEFKAAVEPFILDKMSPANKLQMTTLLSTVWDNLVNNVAQARNVEVSALQQYASDLSLLSDPQLAVQYKMIDELLYQADVEALLTAMTDQHDKPEYVSLSDYIDGSAVSGGKVSKNKIALIYADGQIVDGRGGDGEVGGATLAARLAKVRKDDKVKAVVFRINSPGGSALASEVIWHEVELMRKEKPIVVSMGNYAASGGYYIACPADVILASPTTLTGSIGVFGLLLNGEKTFQNKLGITFDGVKTNTSADLDQSILGLGVRSITEAERTRIRQGIERIYTTFVGHVAAGRNLTTEEVDRIGEGRVWSGASAHGIGLVDGFGGLKDAVALAADRADLGQDFRVVSVTEQESNPLAMIIDMLSETRTDSFDREIETFYRAYRQMVRALSYNGVQALMPYTVEIR